MRWRRAAGVLWRAAPGYLALATVDGRTIEVHGPGREVWICLRDWILEEDLNDTLAGQYDADKQLVGSDVRALLTELHARGYVDRDA
jgi:hypothetical protein